MYRLAAFIIYMNYNTAKNVHPRKQIRISEVKSSAGFKDFYLLHLTMYEVSIHLIQVLAIEEGISNISAAVYNIYLGEDYISTV